MVRDAFLVALGEAQYLLHSTAVGDASGLMTVLQFCTKRQAKTFDNKERNRSGNFDRDTK